MRRPQRILAGGVAAALALGLAAASPALAAPKAPTAIVDGDASGPAQFYVLSFTEAPIAEVAEDVVGGALGLSIAVDPAVDGVMSFRAEGWFSPEALLREFGAAALDQEVALVRSRAGDLALVPRPNLAPELAAGGLLVALPLPGTATPGLAGAPTSPPAIVYGRDRMQDGPPGFLLVFLAGCVAGAAALLGGQTFRRRIEARHRLTEASLPMQRLIHDPGTGDTASTALEDSELTIPRFDRTPAP